MLNNKIQKRLKKLLPTIVLILIMVISVGYSAFVSNLNISNIALNVRLKRDIRITGISLASDTSKKYLNGEAVYFDVVEGSFCSSSEYKSSYDESLGVYSNSISGYNGLNGTGNQNSCLRFYAFNDDGSNKINLLLDHNTTDSFVGWDELYTISDGPVDALVTLYNDTDNWNGTLTPTNYTYTNDSWITYEINYSGHKARLITAEEVAKITGNTNFNSKTAVYDNLFYLDTNSQDISNTCNSEDISGCKYNWMIEQNTSPYHTATTLSDGSGPWGVSNWDAPQLTTEGIYDSATNMGIRPVIEVEKISSSSIQNGGTSAYQEYNVKSIDFGINLPNENSNVIFNVEITNIGNVEMGIYDITGLPDNLEYEILDYNLKDKLCDSENKCSLGISKTIQIKIKYKENGYNSNNTTYNVKLDFNFQPYYTITYKDITDNGYQSEIISGDTLELIFTSPIPRNIRVYTNDALTTDYTYENNKLTLPNVSGNVTIEGPGKAYLAQLEEGAFFKEDAYRTTITDVYFVDYIDTSTATDATAIYDLSENNDESIMGWIDTNNNLYIGSFDHIYAKNLSFAFAGMSALENIDFDNLKTSETTNMNYMFFNATGLTNLDLTSFDTSNVTSMWGMFQNMQSLKTIDLSSFDTSNVKEMVNMFAGVSSLTSLDLSNFNTSKVTSMRNMFAGTSSLTSLDLSNFNTSNVTNMYAMFKSNTKLESLDISSFDTSNVTNMAAMFRSNNNLVSLDLSSFNTEKVENMDSMFQECSTLSELDLSNFKTPKLTITTYMFAGCTNLTTLDLSNFDTSKVKYMSAMFKDDISLTSLNLSSFTAPSLIETVNMFSGCSSLQSLDISSFNTTEKLTNMRNMFGNCSSLQSLDMKNFVTTNVTDMYTMFYGNTSLTYLDIRKMTFDSLDESTSMFYGIPNNVTIITLNDTTKNFISNNLTNGGTIIKESELPAQ